MKIKTLIIDDEKLSRELIRSFLIKYPQIAIIDEAVDGFDALQKINSLNPDLLILDIQMPKINGFELLQVIEKEVLIVFITAYDEYALQAFENNAIDYLLKPFSEIRFEKAINKVIDIFTNKNNQEPAIPTLKILQQIKTDRIVVKTGANIDVVLIEDIVYIESLGDYSVIYTATKKIIKQKPLKEFADMLDDRLFIRTHKSFIVNSKYIIKIEKFTKDSYISVLSTNVKVPVSKAGYKELRDKLDF